MDLINSKGEKIPKNYRQQSKYYCFGGFPRGSINILHLLSELEGSYQHLKYMGFKEDMETIEEIKQRYYKLYFQTKKREKNETEGHA